MQWVRCEGQGQIYSQPEMGHFLIKVPLAQVQGPITVVSGTCVRR